MAKYRVTMAIKELFELEIEADSYEDAVDMVVKDIDFSDFNETGIVTEQFEVEEIGEDE
jgi:hypothetical protein